MSKQMRISSVIYDEISRLSEEYDIDRKSILNASIVLLKCIMKNNADFVEFVDKNNQRISMPVPILFKKSI